MSAEGTNPPFLRETGPPGTRFSEVRRFVELDSTNRYLIDVARTDVRHGLVAVAEHQTAGRGRLGRRWEAPPGANLLASVLLRPILPLDQLHLCTIAVALAAAGSCRRSSGLEPEVKWPNDLVVGERKVAGVLAESVPLPTSATTGAGGRAVVVGVGLNSAWPPPDDETTSSPVPPEIRDIATSIKRETGRSVEPRILLELLLADLEHRLDDLDDPDGRRRLAGEYRDRCSTLGRVVRVTLSDEILTGAAVDVTVEGHLVLDVGTCFKTITAGDVVHVHGAA
ncbi:MAG: biotin--[acetyl-CoA-carboxylase] ligase [Acidimicrobiales bacterium]